MIDQLSTATQNASGIPDRTPEAWPPARPEARPAKGRLELAVVVPTFNERDNVKPLLALLEHALAGLCYEVIFVDDDSTDGTAALIRTLAESDPYVRVLQRIGRRGLSSACLEGMMATA